MIEAGQIWRKRRDPEWFVRIISYTGGALSSVKIRRVEWDDGRWTLHPNGRETWAFGENFGPGRTYEQHAING